jgi:hypothetical protein
MGILEPVAGVGGACAIWAIPPVRSTLSKVVGLVLAAILWKVRGFERYEEDEREGEGEGGELGGSGRREASSSASRLLVGDHIESWAQEERYVETSPSPSASSSSFVTSLVSVEVPADLERLGDTIWLCLLSSRSPLDRPREGVD